MQTVKVGLMYPMSLAIEKIVPTRFGILDTKVEANMAVSSLYNELVQRLEKYTENESSGVRVVRSKTEPLRSPTGDGKTWVVHFHMENRPMEIKKTVAVCRRSISLLEEVLKEYDFSGRVSYEFVWEKS